MANDNTNGDNTQQALDGLITRQRDKSSTSAAATGAASTPISSAVPGGVSGYEPLYPNNIPTDSSVKRFITHFFEVADDPDRDEEWVGLFRENATVMMGTDVAKGRAGKFSIP